MKNNLQFLIGEEGAQAETKTSGLRGCDKPVSEKHVMDCGFMLFNYAWMSNACDCLVASGSTLSMKSRWCRTRRCRTAGRSDNEALLKSEIKQKR
jgi:hypothetical protein